MRNKGLTLKTILLLLLSDSLETCTHFFFKKGVSTESAFQIHSLHQAFLFIASTLSSGYIWLGLLCVFCTFVLWSTILSNIDLSAAVPIASFSYIFVPLVSIAFLHEKVTLLRWLGICLILAGVMAVSLSAKTRGEKGP